MANPNTIRVYTLDGSLDYPVEFDYLARRFVVVTLLGPFLRTPLTYLTQYTFDSPTMIRLASDLDLTGYTSVEIRRVTSTTERLVVFNDASILTASDMNLSDQQVFHVAEEGRDAATDAIGTNDDGNLDARQRRIVNLGNPVDLSDAVNKDYVDNLANGAGQSAAAAAVSAAQAALSATNANASAGSAATSATAAAASRDNAAASATSATASQTASATSAGVASAAASLARLWAMQDGPATVDGTYMSSRAYALLSASSASSATSSAAAAAQSALDAQEAASLKFLQDGTGAVERLYQDKNRDIVSVKDYGAKGDNSTVDNAAINAAITYSLANGGFLWWPLGTYLTNANIPNFHSVRHLGPGAIRRGTDVFYVDPVNGQQNTLYVSTTGSSTTFDGLSAGQPMANLQTAFNVFNFRGHLKGNWVVQHAAGTYSGVARTARLGPPSGNLIINGVLCENFITIQGPDVGYDPLTNPWPTPTVIYEGGSTAAAGIISIGIGTKLLIRDMKFQNYNGSSSSAGILGQRGTIRTENVHTSGCFYGVSNFGGELEMVGGDLYGSPTKQYTAIRSMFLNKHSIGNQQAGSEGQGPRIRFCNQGLFAQEGATGHSDFVRYEDTTIAISAIVNSRVNFTGSKFYRCNVGARALGGSSLFYDLANLPDNFNLGTADATADTIVIQGGSVDSARDGYSMVSSITDVLTAPVTYTGGTGNNVVVAKALDRGRYAPVMNGTRKPIVLKVTAYGTQTGANSKQFKCRLGGTTVGGVTTSTEVNAWKYEAYVTLQSPTSQQIVGAWECHLGTSKRVGINSTSFDMRSADTTLQFEVQLTNAADSVTVLACHIEVSG